MLTGKLLFIKTYKNQYKMLGIAIQPFINYYNHLEPGHGSHDIYVYSAKSMSCRYIAMFYNFNYLFYDPERQRLCKLDLEIYSRER